MKIMDLHCDTIMRFYGGEHLREMEDAHINLKKLREGDWLAQCFAIFVPTGESARRKNLTDTPREYVEKAYAAFQRELEDCREELLPARSVAEIMENDSKGKMSAVLTIEDSVSLEGELEELDHWAEMGVKMASLIWNYENSLGFPQTTDPEAHMLPLKPFGIEAVRRMNELGIAVDVSHLNEGGFWDVVKHSKKPFLASHSCARALCDHPRDLRDPQLRALGEKGGVVGVNYLTSFLRPVTDRKTDNLTTIDLVVKHLRHMANVAGMESVALGSDYDGMRCRMEWGDAAGQQLLVRGMEKEFHESEIEKICHGNALRVFREIWGE